MGLCVVVLFVFVALLLVFVVVVVWLLFVVACSAVVVGGGSFSVSPSQHVFCPIIEPLAFSCPFKTASKGSCWSLSHVDSARFCDDVFLLRITISDSLFFCCPCAYFFLLCLCDFVSGRCARVCVTHLLLVAAFFVSVCLFCWWVVFVVPGSCLPSCVPASLVVVLCPVLTAPLWMACA